MILLGAGASKIFGLKTLQDLTSDLIDKMKQRGHEDTIHDIIEALKRFHLTPDFENVYMTLEALANPEEGVRKSGPFSAYIAYKSNLGITGDAEASSEYREILSDFRNLIYEECTIRKGMIENNRWAFDNLFRETQEYSEGRRLSSVVGTVGARRVAVGDTIVTTNYDMAVELYHRLVKRELADGFKTTSGEYTKELDIFEYGRKDASRWLIKLHGSIWQFRQNGNIVKTIADPRDLPLTISVGEQMMIYPIGEKPILQHPYFSFYYIFKDQPWETLVAIGHSFRDEPINTAILERLSVDPPPKTKLIIVNPHAEETIQNLGPRVSEFAGNIIRIRDYFRDDKNLFARIKIALDCRDWNDYKGKAVRKLGSF